ncbi:hypothetical protein SKAU_G00235130 [Synaphobranchus kaupii]|uniref:Uncharacterized protein n=1 Tax=Synaphobranchus kaupii TaxID=118154 RepID=A0A9Q1F6D2_SYNKA|nr:hypothetical protein SKAU_G00235130 [Synaphobranchus kaupii]
MKNRFQMDLYSQQDSLIHLVWEVNMRLKLQDISLGLGMTLCTSELPALNVYDTQHAAFSDLESTAFNKPAGRRLPGSCFDGRSVVQRAIQEITEALAHPPARPPTLCQRWWGRQSPACSPLSRRHPIRQRRAGPSVTWRLAW